MKLKQTSKQANKQTNWEQGASKEACKSNCNGCVKENVTRSWEGGSQSHGDRKRQHVEMNTSEHLSLQYNSESGAF